MHYFHLTLLILSSKFIHGSLSDTSRTQTDGINIPILRELINYFQHKTTVDGGDEKAARNKSNALKTNAHEKYLRSGRVMPPSVVTRTTGSNEINKGRHFHLDPVLNSLKNRRLWRKEITRSSSISSSEVDVRDWKAEVRQERTYQTFLAMNRSQVEGDVVNMKAVRPFGIQCGDPNQHDLPWGTCMLPAECEPEYRIYRGDYFCGRNTFVCCGLERTAYDMYQGLDMSFQRENSLSTDSEDEHDQISHYERDEHRKKRKQERKRKKRYKEQLKKRLRNSIKNIITEITELLQKAYRNGTAHRAKKTKELKDFIKKMKKQYRKDRKTLVDAHDFNMANYEIKLSESMNKIRGLNQAFMLNDTFRDIVVNGTVNKENLLRLQKTHPVLSLFFNNRRMGGGDIKSRPDNIKLMKAKVPESEKKNEEQNPKDLEYDLEYGLLYY